MTSEHQLHEPTRIVPHPRTIRKAREQVKVMVKDGVSLRKISRYLYRFVTWWVTTSIIWTHEEMLDSFIRSCWDPAMARMAYGFLRDSTESWRRSSVECSIAA